MFEVNLQLCGGPYSQPSWAARGPRATGCTPLVQRHTSSHSTVSTTQAQVGKHGQVQEGSFYDIPSTPSSPETV